MSEQREPRLGDIVDDYCTRCRLLMNHGVMGMVGSEIKRVRCNTCMTEHAYRHARIPRKKSAVNKLFDEVLARIPTPTPPAESESPPPRRRSAHLGMRTTAPPADPEPERGGVRRRRGRSRRPPGGAGGGRRGGNR